MNKKSILEFLHIDISDFFSKSFKEIGSEDSLAIISIDYELRLDIKEFDLFNYMRLRVMFDKLNIESEQHVNVHLYCRPKAPSIKKSNTFLYELYSILGEDIHNDIFSKKDIIPNAFFTSWHSKVGDSFIQVHRHENHHIEFHILFVNNILKEYNKKIEF